MNILVLELDPINAEISGVGQTTLSLSKAWLDAGHNVSIMMPREWFDYLLLKGVLRKAEILEVERSPVKKSISNIPFIYCVRLLQSTKHILKSIRDKNVDFVFADSQVSLIAAYFARMLNSLKYRRKPIIIVPFYHLIPRNSSHQKEHVKYLAHVSVVLSLTFANRLLRAYFFTESTLTAKMLHKDFMIPAEKILAIGGGIDDEFIEKLRKASTTQKLFDACFVGRIHPAKGVFDLVNVWNTVRCRIPEAKLAIIGGGYPQYREMMEKEICKLDLRENIMLCGYVSDEDKFKILMQSKFLVHPAYEECIPLTFFEAASVNLPIITYYLPTYENVLECLIPVKKGDVKLLAETLVNCISIYNSNKKAFYPLIEKEKDLVRKHTWKNIARTLLTETHAQK